MKIWKVYGAGNADEADAAADNNDNERQQLIWAKMPTKPPPITTKDNGQILI